MAVPHRSFFRRAVKGVLSRLGRFGYRCLVVFRFRNLQRVDRDRCWCGGALKPSPWHPAYGLCVECGCHVNKRPPAPQEASRIYSRSCYWGLVSRLRGWPVLADRAALYEKDGRLRHWLELIKKYGSAKGTVSEVGCAPRCFTLYICNNEVIVVWAWRLLLQWRSG